MCQCQHNDPKLSTHQKRRTLMKRDAPMWKETYWKRSEKLTIQYANANTMKATITATTKCQCQHKYSCQFHHHLTATCQCHHDCQHNYHNVPIPTQIPRWPAVEHSSKNMYSYEKRPVETDRWNGQHMCCKGELYTYEKRPDEKEDENLRKETCWKRRRKLKKSDMSKKTCTYEKTPVEPDLCSFQWTHNSLYQVKRSVYCSLFLIQKRRRHLKRYQLKETCECRK